MKGVIFLGDTAWPRPGCLDVTALQTLFAKRRVVLNLEGPLIDGASRTLPVNNTLKFNLYSDRTFTEVAKSLNVTACGLANNHITDFRHGVSATLRLLQLEGIDFFGTVDKPFCELTTTGRRMIVVGACSPLPELVLQHDDVNPSGFKAKPLLRYIADLRRSNSDAQLVVFIHWGYELSLYPEPADREWARQVIDEGADFVIGHHPHVVQGVERYHHGVIAYSLGNFLLPQTQFGDRVLRYLADDVLVQLGFEVSGTLIRLHWMRYNVQDAKVNVERTGTLEGDERIGKLTPYAGFGNHEYRQWFAETGRRGFLGPRRGGPVFWGYSGLNAFDAALKTRFMALKRKVRKLAIRSGLHKPYNW